MGLKVLNENSAYESYQIINGSSSIIVLVIRSLGRNLETPERRATDACLSYLVPLAAMIYILILLAQFCRTGVASSDVLATGPCRPHC